MKQVTVKVIDPVGLHARPASIAVKTASQFKSNIEVHYNGKNVNLKSIMGVITMAAGYNTVLTLHTDGADEKEAAEAIVALFDSKFEEE